MTTDIISNAKESFERWIKFLQDQYAWLQAGRANPAMVENILVDVYGQKMHVKAIWTISIPEPQQILITPWDKSILSSIEKAIRDSWLWFNPMSQWGSIRITLPHMTEERRKELIKIVHTMAEEAKIAVRVLRHEAKSKLETTEKNKEISEDMLKRALEHLDEETHNTNKHIEELCKKKEESIIKI